MTVLVPNASIRPSGGLRLRRAALAAFNRVPGRIGRYNVTLLGDATMLSEVRPTGEVPLMVVGPGTVGFPYVPGIFEITRNGRAPVHCPIKPEDYERGYPFNRMAALWDMIRGPSPDVSLIWGPAHLSPLLQYQRRGRPEVRLFLGQTFSTVTTGRGDCAIPGGLGPDFARTFYGNCRPGSIEGPLSLLSTWSDYAAEPGAPSRRVAALWARVLLSGLNPDAPRQSDIDSLADIGPEPQIWSGDTDPGGDGDPAGEDDGDRGSDFSEDDEPEFDDDGEPVARAQPRAPTGPMPGTARSSFRDWEQSVPELNAAASAVRERAASAREQRLREQRRDSNRRINEQLERVYAESPPECYHCSVEPNCRQCQAYGRCATCNRDLRQDPGPAHAIAGQTINWISVDEVAELSPEMMRAIQEPLRERRPMYSLDVAPPEVTPEAMERAAALLDSRRRR